MKPILKRDLPFAKAGEEIDEIASYRGLDKPSHIIIGNYKCDIPEDVDIFDWIEEVKPREFVVAINRNTGDLIVSDRLEQIRMSGSEIIKVREVIE